MGTTKHLHDPTLEELVDVTIQGISTAQKDYKQAWQSHVFNSAYCPEYLMKVYIFQSLLRLRRKCGSPYGLSLEEPVRTIIDHLPTTRGRYPGKLRLGGKCDLVFWEEKEEEKPLVAIEVKEDITDHRADIGRLAALVQRNLRLGIFASCKAQQVRAKREDAEAELLQTTDSMCKDIQRCLSKEDRSLRLTYKLGNTKKLRLEGDEESLVWCPACLLISKKRSRR